MKKLTKVAGEEFVKVLDELEIEKIMSRLYKKFLTDMIKKRNSKETIKTFLFIMEEKRKHLYKLYKLS